MDVKQGIRRLDKNTKAKLLTGKGFWESAECRQIGLDSVILSDGPHGLRVQKSNANHLGLGKSLPATCYPTAATMACSWDIELCEELGRYLGEEAASQGAVAKIFYAVAWVCGRSKNVVIANSMTHLPLRFLAVFMHLDAVQTEGFIDMCNGRFFKGLKKIIFKK